MVLSYEKAYLRYERHCREITENADNWKSFLTTAANNFKYTFEEQVMIHAQKPGAVACADMKTWNRLGRWISKGSNGIILIDREKKRTRYVFDVSDTITRDGSQISLWETREGDEKSVFEALTSCFGSFEETNILSDIIEAASAKAGDDACDSIIDTLSPIISSTLSQNEKDNFTDTVHQIFRNSLSFMLFVRCGVSTTNISFDFGAVNMFDSREAVEALGLRLSNTAEIALRGIASAVRAQRKTQKNLNRTLANDNASRYNDDKETKQLSGKRRPGNERGNDEERIGRNGAAEVQVQRGNGDMVHPRGGLLSSESYSSGGTEDREIRENATEVYSREQPDNVQHDDDKRNDERSPRRSRQESERESRGTRGTDESELGSDRKHEVDRPSILDRDDEQLQGGGRGNSIQGIDLLLNTEDQIRDITEAEAEQASAFSVNESDVEAVLAQGGGIEGSKKRIYNFLTEDHSVKECMDFLKNEYGTGGRYPVISSDRGVISEDHNIRGIVISVKRGSETAEKFVAWNTVAKCIREMIKNGRYLTPDEQERYGKNIGGEQQSLFVALNSSESLSDTQAVAANENNAGHNRAETAFTPVYQEYINIKRDNADRIVLWQVGDFFEMYGEDAVAASEALGLILTSRSVGGGMRVQMCGIPRHALAEYTKKLQSQDRDLVIASVENGEYTVSILTSADEDKPAETANDQYTDAADLDNISAYNEYAEAKTKYGDCIVLVQVGEFFEIYGEDAEPVARVLDAPFFAVQENERRRLPMCGFPVASYNDDLYDKLASLGRSIVLILDADGERQEAVFPARVSAEASESVQSTPQNYKITNDALGVGSRSDKIRNNLLAIRTLKEIEAERRDASPEEQAIMAQYVGWGGLSEQFSQTGSSYEELKSLLTDEEYTSARASTLSAFYTPPVVIRSIYKALENMGFRTGNILEPSCATGNFIGMLPDAMESSKVYGVEIDSISGRIAKLLYPGADITISGFENTAFADGFFDCAVGNVPFGQDKIFDKRYTHHNFLIHDYFFARTLDLVRTGGLIAFITSTGTLDKRSSDVRKYIAERADLLGAIRLPNNTFRRAAGTDVTSDIIFLKKKEAPEICDPDWIHLGKNENGIPMNQYFLEHPEMILGEMREESGQYGRVVYSCVAYPDKELGSLLSDAIENIRSDYVERTAERNKDADDPEPDTQIAADPNVRNYSFAEVDGKVYYRENDIMKLVNTNATAERRIKGMIKLRDAARKLIDCQVENYDDATVAAAQTELLKLYNRFVRKYGRINTNANNIAFNEDNSYYLLSSLEEYDSEGNFVRLADIFYKRTIKPNIPVTSVDTASEAYAVSIGNKARVDMEYMQQLTGKTEEELYEELKGVIFLNPLYGYGNNTQERYLPADEYLSGNVREKLEWAKRSAELNPEDYNVNVEALEAVQPKDLTAAEIYVRLGDTWLPEKYVDDFIYEIFDIPYYYRDTIRTVYCDYTCAWKVEGKLKTAAATTTFGTSRKDGFEIIESSLNLRTIEIYDYIEIGGKKKPVLNQQETALAQEKQRLINERFSEWVWADPVRRDDICRMYNDKFNSIRPREYDGSHLNFYGINHEIRLREHQLNAIARIIYGGNTLLAHVVGAGKTYEMVAAAMEMKHLGLCQKSLIVVPNHLTEQWGAEFMRLYPAANILVTQKKDFEAKNRKKICARIATGDYDAVIIGQSQFEKIPISAERQRQILEKQLDDIMIGIDKMKRDSGNRFTVKELERSRKSIKAKLDALNDQEDKDDVVTFEELGIDRLFIDEAHYYKNLAAFSKMRNVGGIAQTEAKKSSDLFAKCRYLDEITGGRGIIFATGTPISNTMVEMYTMQKYLQFKTLHENGLFHFDAWAANFGETVTAAELSPEGGFRSKTRLARFHNLPELTTMFREVADIRTADMLNLPVPAAIRHNVVLDATPLQKELVAGLSSRAEKVRNGGVSSDVDNMLCITNDGRRLALDPRLINDMFPDDSGSKVQACADKVYEIWDKTTPDKSTQLIFCDLSVPKSDGSFSVYTELRKKLVSMGIPDNEIAFIHSAETDTAKAELFAKVRSGDIRVLLGSTQKMGAGTNVQDRLIALHHLDCPWRPSDLEQREGRIIRQGNKNTEVHIYTYVTKETFDSYLYQMIERKQRFISQIMTSKSPVRSAEDIDEQSLSYAEIKALCMGNPLIKEKMELDIEVARLKLVKSGFLSAKYDLEHKISVVYPARISSLQREIDNITTDIPYLASETKKNKDGFSPMQIENTLYTDKKSAGEALLKALSASVMADKEIGCYRGFSMTASYSKQDNSFSVRLSHAINMRVQMGNDVYGNITRIDNALATLDEMLSESKKELDVLERSLESAKAEVIKPFPNEDELTQKEARLKELNHELEIEKSQNEIIGEVTDDTEGRELHKTQDQEAR